MRLGRCGRGVSDVDTLLEDAEKHVADKRKENRAKRDERIDAAEKGIRLDSNVLKEIRVKIACRRRLQVGDKMAGRHGNKGVISIVVPTEDMPYDKETGDHVDMILNPLGVPSRMNIGQVFETHLGLAMESLTRKVGECFTSKSEKKATRKLADLLVEPYCDLEGKSDIDLWKMAEAIQAKGLKCAVPPFGRTDETTLRRLLATGGEPESGQKILVDGKSGEEFHRACHGRRDVHDEVASHGRHQDTRQGHWPLQQDNAATDERQCVSRWAAFGRDGSVGIAGVWRRSEPSGNDDVEVGSRRRQKESAESHLGNGRTPQTDGPFRKHEQLDAGKRVCAVPRTAGIGNECRV